MITTRVLFARQERPEKARLLCSLVEDCFRERERILVFLQDEQQAMAMDRFLWTWDKGAFLPHAYNSGAVECVDEPIVITCKEENPNGASVLIMGIPCSIDFIGRFDLAIDLAEVYDETLLQESRQRFKHYRDNGFHPAMYPPPQS